MLLKSKAFGVGDDVDQIKVQIQRASGVCLLSKHMLMAD